jgi:hypothetical protein
MVGSGRSHAVDRVEASAWPMAGWWGTRIAGASRADNFPWLTATSRYNRQPTRAPSTPTSISAGQALKSAADTVSIRASLFVEKVEVATGRHPGKGGDMTEYLIAFNDEWVPDHTVEELREKSKATRALIAEMKAAGVFIFTGGLDVAAPVFSVDASSGTPVFTDGPFTETKEHLGGFAVVDVADEEEARLWAGKIAVACGWPQEVRPFMVPMQPPGA